ncbi:hypothetical protein FNH22_13605 [Fulvivirga sp. M361]|uniref:hypothetical protein n=1 Tax=Fulvivirga sp. M361 TaxID=2594266 RepID=UPI001179E7E4|nr:hypothetical protein [Fulvivirga sp. M361]TRX58380.1 hypothetical protein FNH22_13605 [Fulvivirga sp. M361]
MDKNIRYIFTIGSIIIGSSLTFYGCQKSANSTSLPPSVSTVADEEFGQYWYTGKAEVSSYKLKQSRYGEIHEGDAVLIFVTEPFSNSKQVKLDYPDKAGSDNVSVMKLNYTKKFNTGIYPYSMMLSSFTPIDTYHHTKTLKVTTSVQEWCGHVFTQMNLNKDEYKVNAYSYFEQEGDNTFTMKHAFMEDEIFNRIRIDYKTLPTGEFQMIPGLFYTRLTHKELEVQNVSAELSENDDTFRYLVKFKESKRTLNITFQKAFPYQILRWEDTYNGAGGKTLTTSAELNKSLYTPYWAKNSKVDIHLRDSLDLRF